MAMRWAIGLGVLMAGVSILLADAPVGPATQSAKVHTVIKGTLLIVAEGDGTFEAVDPLEVRVRPKVYAGELTVTAAAENGALVKKGDLLLQIDPSNLNRDLAGAENESLLAKATLKKAQEDVRLGEAADKVALTAATQEVANATTNLKWFDDTDGPNAIKMADLQLKEFKDRIEDQQDELDQLKKMYKTEELTSATADIVVKRALRQLKRAEEQAPVVESMTRKTKEVANPQTRFAAESAAARTQVALEQLQVTQQQAKVARETGLVAAQIAAARAEQKVTDLRADLEQLTVRSPADGVVYYGAMAAGQWQNHNPKALRAGEKVVPQQVLLTLIAPGKLRVVMAVAENKLAAVRVGAKASVVPKSLPELKYTGTVASIARLPGLRANAAGYDVQIELADLDKRLGPTMTAGVKIDPEKVDGVLTIPAGAVANGKVTVRGTDGKDLEREVTVGRSDAKRVEILNGLNEGEKVVEK